MKIDHVAIYTKNLDRLKAFYEYYFGEIKQAVQKPIFYLFKMAAVWKL